MSVSATAQTLWGGHLFGVESKNRDSLVSFNASAIRTFSLGNAFTQFTGPTTPVKTFTLPDEDATILTTDAAVTVAQGGTGRISSITAYGLIAAGTTATGAHQTLAAGATTEILVGGGASALPVWTTATGSGAPVRATSPALVTPSLGTPTSGNLGSCTNYQAANLSGIVPGANGGTNNGFMQFTGPATSLKTFTLPNATATILTSNAAVTVAQGGTGATTLTGVLQGNGTGAVTATNGTTAGNVLQVSGTNVYAFGAVDLTNNNSVTGVLPFANGGQDIVTGRVTGQTAAVASIATLTVGGADATYMVSGNILVTTSSAESFSLQVDFTDEGNTARTATIPLLRISTGAFLTATLSALGAVPYPSTDIHIRCKASTAITIKTSGTFTGCVYSAQGKIQMI